MSAVIEVRVVVVVDRQEAAVHLAVKMGKGGLDIFQSFHQKIGRALTFRLSLVASSSSSMHT